MAQAAKNKILVDFFKIDSKLCGADFLSGID
jgi:hypothetical protein